MQERSVTVGAERRRGPAELERVAKAKLLVLGARNLVAVADGREVVLDGLDANERIVEVTVLRQRRRGGLVRRGVEVRVLAPDAEDRSPRPAVLEAVRPAEPELRELCLPPVARNALAESVHGLDGLVLRHRDAGAPAAVERVERPLEAQAPTLAVVAVAIRDVADPARAGHVRVVPMERVGAAVRVLRELERQLFPVPEQVQLLELDSAGVLAARAAERDARVGRPDLARGHLDRRRTVAAVARADGRFADIAQVPEVPERLVD